MKETFDGNTIRKARNAAAKGVESKIYDSACSGLAIRTYKSGRASWCVLTRDWKATIADLSVFSADDLPDLRELVAESRRLKSDGKDPVPLIQEFVRRRDVAEAGHHADVVSGEAETWNQARDRYLVWLKENRSADTYRSYRSAIGAVEGSPLQNDFAPMNGKPLASVSLDDMVRVRENILRRGRQSVSSYTRQANLTVSVLKSFWSWQLNREGNPISVNPAADLGKARERRTHIKAAGRAEEQRSLLQDEIGLIIHGLGSHPKVAPRNALLLQLMTGQRRMTVAQARKESFYEHSEYGLVWRLEDKTHSWRVIPLSPTARLAVETAKTFARDDSPYLFPQMRERKVGQGMGSHMNERTISEVLEDLRQPGRILSSIPFPVSTHDLRKAFISTMASTMHKHRIGDRVLQEKDISMITHDDEGRDTTATMVYDKNPYLPIKAAILGEWEQWCLEGYENVRKSTAA